MIKFKRMKTMRSWLAVSILASITLMNSAVLTGCGANGESGSKESVTSAADTTKADPGEVLTITTESSSSETNPAEAQSNAGTEQRDYFGTWTVEKVLAYAQVGTYSKEDAEKLIGKNLNFASEEAQLINDQPEVSPVTFKNPEYEETVTSTDDVTLNYSLTFEQLELKEGTVTEVAVSGTDQDAGGCTLLIQDSQSMILCAGGTFFKLIK